MYAHQPSGMSLTLFRAYDPTTARWLSRDPAGESHGINLYAYVDNGPVDGIDPLGLWEVTITAADVYGGQISFGSNNGHANFGFSVGVGLGGGLDIDPSTDCDNNKWDGGLVAQAQLGLTGIGGVGGSESYDDRADAPFGLAADTDEQTITSESSATFNDLGLIPGIKEINIGKGAVTNLATGQTCPKNDVSGSSGKKEKPFKAQGNFFGGVHFNIPLW
jgi:RHS repeat-associated protein